MSGDFLVESTFGFKAGVAGGNFFILAENQMAGVMAAEAAVDAISAVEGVITPFPGGMVASGSKVGCNNYKFLNASTNEKMCVTLKDKVDSDIREDANGVFEIVIDGIDEESVRAAMKAGIEAACNVPGVLEIDAGNFGGNLGAYKTTYKIYLRALSLFSIFFILIFLFLDIYSFFKNCSYFEILFSNPSEIIYLT